MAIGTWKVFTVSLFETRWDANINTIETDVEGNNGTTQADIQTRTGVNATNTSLCLDSLVKSGRIVERDDGGTTRYWGASQWATMIETNITPLMTHLGSTNPSTITSAATALSLTEAETLEIIYAAEGAGKVRLVEKE